MSRNEHISAEILGPAMIRARKLHVGMIGEAPIAFHERDVAFPECPWAVLVDILRSLALPEDRDAAVIASMFCDYAGGIVLADNKTVLINPLIAGDVVKAARVFGKQFDREAWCQQFVTASDDALRRILMRLPPDHRDLYAEVARSNTWGAWS